MLSILQGDYLLHLDKRRTGLEHGRQSTNGFISWYDFILNVLFLYIFLKFLIFFIAEINPRILKQHVECRLGTCLIHDDIAKKFLFLDHI